jgi:hypothetical protein
VEASDRTSASPPWAALAAWLVPGLGHLLLGRRGRAALFALLGLGSLALGCALEGSLYAPVIEGSLLARLINLCMLGLGAPYLLLRFALDYHGSVVAQSYDYGTAFLLTAALMNLLLVLDAWDIARGAKE